MPRLGGQMPRVVINNCQMFTVNQKVLTICCNNHSNKNILILIKIILSKITTQREITLHHSSITETLNLNFDLNIRFHHQKCKETSQQARGDFSRRLKWAQYSPNLCLPAVAHLLRIFWYINQCKMVPERSRWTHMKTTINLSNWQSKGVGEEILRQLDNLPIEESTERTHLVDAQVRAKVIRSLKRFMIKDKDKLLEISCISKMMAMKEKKSSKYRSNCHRLHLLQEAKTNLYHQWVERFLWIAERSPARHGTCSNSKIMKWVNAQLRDQ